MFKAKWSTVDTRYTYEYFKIWARLRAKFCFEIQVKIWDTSTLTDAGASWPSPQVVFLTKRDASVLPTLGTCVCGADMTRQLTDQGKVSTETSTRSRFSTFKGNELPPERQSKFYRHRGKKKRLNLTEKKPNPYCNVMSKLKDSVHARRPLSLERP